jgi:hypothetical protein
MAVLALQIGRQLGGGSLAGSVCGLVAVAGSELVWREGGVGGGGLGFLGALEGVLCETRLAESCAAWSLVSLT